VPAVRVVGADPVTVGLAVSPDASSLLANMPYSPVALGEMEISPVLRPVPIAVSSQAIVPSNCLVR